MFSFTEYSSDFKEASWFLMAVWLLFSLFSEECECSGLCDSAFSNLSLTLPIGAVLRSSSPSIISRMLLATITGWGQIPSFNLENTTLPRKYTSNDPVFGKLSLGNGVRSVGFEIKLFIDGCSVFSRTVTSGQSDSIWIFNFSYASLYFFSSCLVHHLWLSHFWLSFYYQCSITTTSSIYNPFIYKYSSLFSNRFENFFVFLVFNLLLCFTWYYLIKFLYFGYLIFSIFYMIYMVLYDSYNIIWLISYTLNL